MTPHTENNTILFFHFDPLHKINALYCNALMLPFKVLQSLRGSYSSLVVSLVETLAAAILQDQWNFPPHHKLFAIPSEIIILLSYQISPCTVAFELCIAFALWCVTLCGS